MLSRNCFLLYVFKTFGRVMFFVFFFWRYVFSMFPRYFCLGHENHLKPWRLGKPQVTLQDSMAFDANHGPGVSPVAAWMKVLLRQVEQWKKGPWLFAVNKGMKHYPVMLELFHKPWNKDPGSNQPGFNGKWGHFFLCGSVEFSSMRVSQWMSWIFPHLDDNPRTWIRGQ